MTPNQQQDLFVEWDLYPPQQHEAIIMEFQEKSPGYYTRTQFFEFVIEKLQIEGYWKKVGLI